MKNLLLVMPFFMDYEKSLKNELSKYYNVTLINSDIFEKETIDTLYKSKIIRSISHHIGEILKIRQIRFGFSIKNKEKVLEKFTNNLKSLISSSNNYYDVVMCINGYFIPNNFWKFLKHKNKNARFIFYAWDDYKNLFKKSQIEYFNEKYSYNINDCIKYGFSYLPVYVQNNCVDKNNKKIYDIAYIISKHSNRIKIATKLYKKYNKKFNCFFYIYNPYKEIKGEINKFCKKEPLSYVEYLDIISKSKVVIDTPISIQSGPTGRVLDALSVNTKVVTTNRYIKDYPFFSNNIFIINRNLHIDEGFINKDFEHQDYNILTVRDWIANLKL